MSNEDFNKRCAIAAGFSLHEDKQYIYSHPEQDKIWHIDDMEFSTSYDWAMLLVKAAQLKRKYYSFNISLNDKFLTPLQISTAALEVLEA